MLDPLRPASTISDLEFVQAVAKFREPMPPNGYYSVNIRELADELCIHPNRIRSKLRRTNKRELTDGCTCGCRGGVELLFNGELLLLKGETNGTAV